MDEITDLLSKKRLAKYKGIAKEDAFKCHLLNSELAESFYSSLSYFEIILRNKLAKGLRGCIDIPWQAGKLSNYLDNCQDSVPVYVKYPKGW